SVGLTHTPIPTVTTRRALGPRVPSVTEARQSATASLGVLMTGSLRRCGPGGIRLLAETGPLTGGNVSTCLADVGRCRTGPRAMALDSSAWRLASIAWRHARSDSGATHDDDEPDDQRPGRHHRQERCTPTGWSGHRRERRSSRGGGAVSRSTR